MKKELKRLLQQAMEAPEPERKQEFLSKIENLRRNTGGGYGKFVAGQFFFIGKWSWCWSFGILLAAIFVCHYADKDVLWALSALVPFLAVSLMAEGLRSEICGMAELEMATRFSLRSLLLARMTIMGAVHLLLLGVNIFLGHRQGGIALFQTGVYLLVPYLFTNTAGLLMARKVRGRECIYGIFAVAAAVAVFPFVAKLFYREELFIWWLAALIIFASLTIKGWKRQIEGQEEYLWSLQ
ncbi:MAG: hypothetical protein NC429_15125 [Lachnospiraceae bacterium]|nr:hypothetical protein [Lachnospiraceae bacterium]